MNIDEAGQNRPVNVSWGVKLLYLSIFLGIIRAILMFDSLTETNSKFFAVVVLGSVLYFSWFMIFKMAKGKNWARLTYAALFIAGLPFTKPTLFLAFTTKPLSAGIAITQLLLQVVALTLLFQKDSAEWYKKMKRNAQHSAADGLR